MAGGRDRRMGQPRERPTGGDNAGATALSYGERRLKVRRVTEFMGCLDPGELLFTCRQAPLVPGICTDRWCDLILQVRADEEGDFCPDCRRDTVQSILLFAGTH